MTIRRKSHTGDYLGFCFPWHAHTFLHLTTVTFGLLLQAGPSKLIITAAQPVQQNCTSLFIYFQWARWKSSELVYAYLPEIKARGLVKLLSPVKHALNFIVVLSSILRTRFTFRVSCDTSWRQQILASCRKCRRWRRRCWFPDDREKLRAHPPSPTRHK